MGNTLKSPEAPDNNKRKKNNTSGDESTADSDSDEHLQRKAAGNSTCCNAILSYLSYRKSISEKLSYLALG